MLLITKQTETPNGFCVDGQKQGGHHNTNAACQMLFILSFKWDCMKCGWFSDEILNIQHWSSKLVCNIIESVGDTQCTTDKPRYHPASQLSLLFYFLLFPVRGCLSCSFFFRIFNEVLESESTVWGQNNQVKCFTKGLIPKTKGLGMCLFVAAMFLRSTPHNTVVERGYRYWML